MPTQFQNKLIKDQDTLWEIIKTFHPDVPETFKKSGKPVKEKIVAYPHYDWVCIDLRLDNYGTISIGMDNSHQHSLYGPRVNKQDIREALEKGQIYMHCWRFAKDVGYKGVVEDITGKSDKEIEEKAAQLLKDRGYTLQSVDEFYNIYHRD